MVSTIFYKLLFYFQSIITKVVITVKYNIASIGRNVLTD